MWTAIAPDPIADHLDLAGVNAGPDLDSERLHALDGGGRTPDGAAGAVEHREETVAGRVNLASPETGQLATHEGMMALEKLSPRSITVLSREPGRPDDVGEQDRGQDPVGFGHRPGAGNELEDLADECVLVTGPHQLIRPGKLHVPRALDMIGNVAPVLGRNRGRVGT